MRIDILSPAPRLLTVATPKFCYGKNSVEKVVRLLSSSDLYSASASEQ